MKKLSCIGLARQVVFRNAAAMKEFIMDWDMTVEKCLNSFQLDERCESCRLKVTKTYEQ